MDLIPKGYVDNRSIEDVTPNDLKGFTQCHFFAGIAGWAYALRQAGWPDDRPIWTGSCPCFPEDTIIHTREGLIPIQDVRVGMEVLTHRKRWRKVLRTGSDSDKETIILDGGGHWGMECTPNHPFLTSDNDWIRADCMLDKNWININEQPHVPVPKDMNDSLEIDITSEAFAYVLGFWLRNGGINKHTIYVKDSIRKSELLPTAIKACGMDYMMACDPQSYAITFNLLYPGLADFLIRNFTRFGLDDNNKKLPVWLFSMHPEYLETFVKGWRDSDGYHSSSGGYSSLVVKSRQLVVGLKFILVSLGYMPNIELIHSRKDTDWLGEARQTDEYFRVTWIERGCFDDISSLGGVGRVAHILPGRRVTVYNLEVEEDNSYVADGIIVHNCQPFSAAGQRKGTADERHLWPAFFWLISQCKPDTVIGEQVASKDALTWFDLVSADLEGAHYSCAAIDSCAAGFGAPHIRQRLYWMAHSAEQRWRGWDKGDQTGCQQPVQATGLCGFNRLADPECLGWRGWTQGSGEGQQEAVQAQGLCPSDGLANSTNLRSERDSKRAETLQGSSPRSESAGQLPSGFKGCGGDGCVATPSQPRIGESGWRGFRAEDYQPSLGEHPESAGYAFGCFPTNWLEYAEGHRVEDKRQGSGIPGKADGQGILGFDGASQADGWMGNPEASGQQHGSPVRCLFDDCEPEGECESGAGNSGSLSGRMDDPKHEGHSGKNKNTPVQGNLDPILFIGDDPAPERSSGAMPTNGFWANPDWLWCRDKKWRPVKSGSSPLVNGIPRTLGYRGDPRAIKQRLKGYGNAIVIPQAVAFIQAIMEISQEINDFQTTLSSFLNRQ